MKICIIGDPHGMLPAKPKADIIICTGDVCTFSKIRPLIFKGLSSQTPWYDYIGKREAKKLVNQSVKAGRKVMERLNSFNIPVYIVPGNWDFVEKNGWEPYAWDKLKLGLSNIIDVDGKCINHDFSFIGYGKTAGPENDLAPYKKLERLAKKATKPMILLSHNVPYGILDKIGNKSSPRYGHHWGSHVVRHFIDQHQPKFVIAGHMHENYGKKKRGKTLCVNAGFRRITYLHYKD